MRPQHRRTQIAEVIRHQGQTSVEALAQQFQVSVETIRRDLGQLAEDGVLQKIHGGAKPLGLHAEGSFQERMAEDADAKRVIGEKVAALVEPGETLFIDTGSTTLACAEALAGVRGLTVITNSLRIAQLLGADADKTVFLLGGAYGNDNGQTLGPMVLRQIEDFQADHAILTVAALDPAVGAMDANFDEAQVARAMIGNARTVVVAATRAKFGRRAAFRVCRMGEIDVVVADAAPAEAEALLAAGVEVR